MNDHLSAKQLNGYIHQALTDAARETIDAHLASCQMCRGQLAEHTALQQNIRYELLGKLNSVHAPLTLTFESTTSRRRRTASLAWFWQQSVRVFGGLAALVVMAVVVTGVILAVRQPTTSPVVNPSSSRVASTTGYLGGWAVSPGSTEDYEVGLDYEVVHSGKASGYIKSKVSDPKGTGDLMQMMLPDHYAGKRLRLSGYLKTEQVEGRAGLWMGIEYPQGMPSNFDNMVNRPIRGTTDWQKYDIVLDVPANSANIFFGAALIGRGQVWIDDVQFEIVGTDVATTAVTEEMLAAERTPTPTPEPSPLDLVALAQPTNLSFETGTTGWSIVGDAQNYVSGVDSTVTFDGQASGFLAWDASKPIGLGKLVQSIKVGSYRNQRVRISARVKSDQISERSAYFFATVDSSNSGWPLSDSCRMSGDLWQKCELVFDVPDAATRIDYGISLKGQGRAWLDDVQVEIVGKDIQVTAYPGQPVLEEMRLQGVDLDGTMPNWGMYGYVPNDYEMGFDDTIVHSGRSSAYIKSIAPVTAVAFGEFSTGTDVGYRDKRWRLSAYIKATNVQAWAGLWMQVSGRSNRVLSLDNMQNRPIQGTSDWQKYEIVLDAPGDYVWLNYGVSLHGSGEVWFDDVKLEVVGNDVSVTDMPNQSQPINSGFEGENQSGDGSSPTATPTPVPSSKPLAHFGDVVTLTDARWSPAEPAPGATLELSLRWALSSTNSATLMTFAHLVDSQGNIVAQADQPLPQLETSPQTITWQLPAEMSPGRYQIVLGVYVASTGLRLTTETGATETTPGAFEITAPSQAGTYLPWTAGVTHCVTNDATSHGPGVHELDFDLNNEPVLAVQAGVVIQAEYVDLEGNLIKIRQADGSQAVYSHLNRIDVAVGDTIKRGQSIGISGNTGTSTGPHLAFKVLNDLGATTPLGFNEVDHEPKADECLVSNNRP